MRNTMPNKKYRKCQGAFARGCFQIVSTRQKNMKVTKRVLDRTVTCCQLVFPKGSGYTGQPARDYANTSPQKMCSSLL